MHESAASVCGSGPLAQKLGLSLWFMTLANKDYSVCMCIGGMPLIHGCRVYFGDR